MESGLAEKAWFLQSESHRSRTTVLKAWVSSGSLWDCRGWGGGGGGGNDSISIHRASQYNIAGEWGGGLKLYNLTLGSCRKLFLQLQNNRMDNVIYMYTMFAHCYVHII